VLVAVLAILVSRGLVVFGLTYLHQVVSPERRVPVRYRSVMFWGGLRGAISLALALTLTDQMVGGTGIALELQFMTFGAVLFTLLVQGLTIERVIMALGLSNRPEHLKEQQRRQALVYASRAGRRELDRLRDDGILAGDVWRSMTQQYDEEITDRSILLRDHLERWQELEQQMVLQAREDVLIAERAAVTDIARRGLIEEDVNEELVRDLDNRVAAIQLLRARSNIAILHPLSRKDDEGPEDESGAEAPLADTGSETEANPSVAPDAPKAGGSK
jgi:CPA1 family monovalent cation:H+ antiporter